MLGLPILIALATLGGMWLLTGITVVALVGLREFYAAFSPGIKPVHFLGFVFALLHMFFLGYLAFGIPGQMMLFLIPLFLPVLSMMFTVVQGKTRDVILPITVIFGHLYIVFTLSTIYLLRVTDGGAYHVWLVFIAAWGCDTGAYFAGKTLGKRKLAPVLSPKKTWEGAIGGTVCAMLLGAVYGLILWQMGIIGQQQAMLYALTTAVCSVFAQLGDLSASAIKRQQGVKDFGSIIPGHGGVLDRFDSIIFAAPAAFLMVLLLF